MRNKLLGLAIAAGFATTPIFATVLSPSANSLNSAPAIELLSSTRAVPATQPASIYTTWVYQRSVDSLCPNGGCLNVTMETPEELGPSERATRPGLYRTAYDSVAGFSFSDANDITSHDTTASLVTTTNATRYTAGFVSLPDSIAECRQVVPEPRSMLLLGIGLLGAGWLGRRRNRANRTAHGALAK